LPTTCATTFDLLPAKPESPLYTAVIASVPTFKVEVKTVAVPPLNTPAQIGLPW
jgi:hypothetical protein